MSVARRSLQVVAFICTLIVGVTSMAVIVTQTTWFKEWLRGFIVRQAEDYVNGRLSIGRLDGNLFFGVELEDVDVTQNGKTIVGVKDIGLDYNAFTFIVGHVVLDTIRLDQPVLLVEQTAEGWNIAHLIRARTPDPDQPKSRQPIAIGEIGVTDGTLLLDDSVVGTTGTIDLPARIERLDASVGVSSDENELKVSVNHVSLRSEAPAFGVNAMSGTIRRRENTLYLDNVSFRSEETSLRVTGSIQNIEGGSPQVELAVSSDKFDVGEIGKVVPALRGYHMQPAFEVNARGPVNAMKVDLNLREQNVGKVTASLLVDGEAPGRRVAGDVATEHFNIGPVARSAALRSDITGHGRIDLTLPEGTRPLRGTYALAASSVDVDGYRARNVNAKGRVDGNVVRVTASALAYGGRATASGSVRAAQPLVLDLSGQAAGLDLRNLPPSLKMPGAPSNLQFAYRLSGRGSVYSGDVTMARSTLAGATIAPGTVGAFRVGAGAPEYSAKGEVANLDIEQVGRAFAVPVLAVDKYRGTVNATFDVRGTGGGRYPLTLDATGTATNSEMFGARFPRLDVTTHIGGGDAQVKAVGQFAHLNPERIVEDPRSRGDLSGAVDATTTIRGYASRVTVDSVDVEGRVNLADSDFGGFHIDTGVVDGTFARRQGTVNQLAVTGPDIAVQGSGPIAFNDVGASNLTLHVETPVLERVGALLEQPLKGAAVVDATVTGNGQRLQAQGTLKGSNVAYGDNSALALDSTFDLAVPNVTVADATLKAKSAATFLSVGGQQVNEVTADTTYTMNNLEFNGTARQGIRVLQAAGALVVHPDHREVHVRSLALRSEMIEWTTAQGNEATVRYGVDRIEVNNLKLVSGDQAIDADGVVGKARESLKVTARNVDVARLDALLLGDQRLAGRLTGTAIVSGTTSAPSVNAEFSLAPGSFRTFTFESFAGTVDYAARGLTLDVRLQQNAQGWLTAKGFAPVSLFRTNPPEAGPGHTAAAPGEAVNIDVQTSQVDLGIIQGFTSYVTNVAGTLQANVRVTGSGVDPHAEGFIDIKGGAFVVPDLGTAFTGLDTRVDLKPDQITIAQMRVLDKQGQPMTIGGTLGVHERTVGAVDLTMKSDTFEVINNKLGHLKLDTDLKLTGDLHDPKLEGSVDVHTGSIDVARVMMEATSGGAYSTTATSINPADSGNPAPEAPSVPTLFDRVHLNIGLAIPSNLVLNGRNLRPANAPIDVGDMSATVGGALQIEKLPYDVLRVYGEVNTVRGSYTFQGRRFDIERDGRIRFFGGNELEPYLNLRASRTISGIQTFVRIQGTLQEPQLSFSSSPPMEEAEILSLIVFNQPINELGEGQQISLAQRASALAGGYLASGLATSIGNALKLDEFQIQAAGDTGAGPQITVGEQIGDNLFFRLRQGFGAEQATELILEYQIKEFLRLQTTAAEAQGTSQRTAFRRIERGGIDLIFFFNY